MAGGNANSMRLPWPNGLYPIFSKCFDIAASKSSDHVVDQQKVPFAFTIEEADFCADVVAISNAITINVEDDTGTPKVGIADSAGVVAITAGASARAALTVDKSKVFYEGALLNFSYKSGASDTATNAQIRLWVKPYFGNNHA